MMKEMEMKRVPKLRFPEFTDDWEQRKLGELTEIKDSARIPNNEWTESGVPYIRASDVTNEDMRGVLFISEEKYKFYKSITGAPEQGDVLFNGGGEIGKTMLNTGNKPIYVQGGAVLYARTSASKMLNGRYMKTYFETSSAKSYIDAASAGGTMKHFTLKPSQEMPIMFPTMSEQQKIGQYFSNLDNLITLHQRKLEKLKKLKKGLVQKLFSQEVRFKADDGSEFPEWEEKKLGEFGTFIKGAALSKADISEYGSPFILYGELYTTYKEVAYNIQRRTQAIVDKKYYSCIGDVVIPTSGESAEEISTATCVMVPNVILGGDLNIFRSDIVDGRIMSYILNHQVKWKIAMIAQGKSIVHIQAKQLSNIYVKYPVSKVEQQKIADCLSLLDDVIEKQKVTLAAWEEMKKGLLQQMFV